MNKILQANEAIKISNQLRDQGKRIVLAGGCFDILHIGHVTFLEKAKAQGDILTLLLESDQTIQKLKGPNRPIMTQQDRAKMLASLSFVDFIILLPHFTSNKEYDDVILKIKPAIITTTADDRFKEHKIRQAEQVGAKLVEVIDYIKNQSTSRIAAILAQEL